jgi:adenylate cyclase
LIVQQVVVLLVARFHGCIGLHFWLRLKAWYPRAVPLFYVAALLIPLLGLLGFSVGGRDVARLADNPDWLAEASATIRFPSEEQVAFLYDLEHGLWIGLLLLAGVLSARTLRH